MITRQNVTPKMMVRASRSESLWWLVAEWVVSDIKRSISVPGSEASYGTIELDASSRHEGKMTESAA
jgi:hypothetical protein